MYTRRRQTIVCIELLVGLHVSFFVRMLFVEDIFYYLSTSKRCSCTCGGILSLSRGGGSANKKFSARLWGVRLRGIAFWGGLSLIVLLYIPTE